MTISEVVPYVIFEGNCEAAFNFYAQCLDGKISHVERYRDSPLGTSEMDKNKVMHAAITFGKGVIMGSDRNEKAGYTKTSGLGSNVILSITIDLKDLQKIFNKLAEGGIVTMPVAEQFWGDTFGMLTDQFGVQWMLSAGLDKKGE